MIRNYIPRDLQRFKPNPESDTTDVLDALANSRFHKYTYEKDGEVKAIVSFLNTDAGDWAGFSLIAESFTARDGIVVKKFLYEQINSYQPTRVWTVSKDNCVLERWHKFLGMTKKEMIEVDGTMCNVWSMEWA